MPREKRIKHLCENSMIENGMNRIWIDENLASKLCSSENCYYCNKSTQDEERIRCTNKHCYICIWSDNEDMKIDTCSQCFEKNVKKEYSNMTKQNFVCSDCIHLYKMDTSAYRKKETEEKETEFDVDSDYEMKRPHEEERREGKKRRKEEGIVKEKKPIKQEAPANKEKKPIKQETPATTKEKKPIKQEAPANKEKESIKQETPANKEKKPKQETSPPPITPPSKRPLQADSNESQPKRQSLDSSTDSKLDEIKKEQKAIQNKENFEKWIVENQSLYIDIYELLLMIVYLNINSFTY